MYEICSHFLAIWSCAFKFSGVICLLLKRTNPGSIPLGWGPMGVPPDRINASLIREKIIIISRNHAWIAANLKDAAPGCEVLLSSPCSMNRVFRKFTKIISVRHFVCVGAWGRHLDPASGGSKLSLQLDQPLLIIFKGGSHRISPPVRGEDTRFLVCIRDTAF